MIESLADTFASAALQAKQEEIMSDMERKRLEAKADIIEKAQATLTDITEFGKNKDIKIYNPGIPYGRETTEEAKS